MKDEESDVSLLLELFGWDDDSECRYHALRILRGARGEAIPTPDDYHASRTRD